MLQRKTLRLHYFGRQVVFPWGEVDSLFVSKYGERNLKSAMCFACEARCKGFEAPNIFCLFTCRVTWTPNILQIWAPLSLVYRHFLWRVPQASAHFDNPPPCVLRTQAHKRRGRLFLILRYFFTENLAPIFCGLHDLFSLSNRQIFSLSKQKCWRLNLRMNSDNLWQNKIQQSPASFCTRKTPKHCKLLGQQLNTETAFPIGHEQWTGALMSIYVRHE